MSDLPEMLRGVIADEYGEIVQPLRFAEAEEDIPPIPPSEKPNTMCGKTCPACPGYQQTKAAFQPALAGWSTPPALDIR